MRQAVRWCDMKSELHAWGRLILALAATAILAQSVGALWRESNEAARALTESINGALYDSDYGGQVYSIAEILRSLGQP